MLHPHLLLLKHHAIAIFKELFEPDQEEDQLQRLIPSENLLWKKPLKNLTIAIVNRIN